MKSLLLALFLTLTFHAPASAEVRKGIKFDQYEVNENNKSHVDVKITHTFETTDACNEFGLQGSFRPVEMGRGESALGQDYVADFILIQTMIGCDPLPEPRTISVESDPLRLEAVNGVIRSRVLVPEKMKLELAE